MQFTYKLIRSKIHFENTLFYNLNWLVLKNLKIKISTYFSCLLFASGGGEGGGRKKKKKKVGGNGRQKSLTPLSRNIHTRARA